VNVGETTLTSGAPDVGWAREVSLAFPTVSDGILVIAGITMG
jgi:hypothetical protein